MAYTEKYVEGALSPANISQQKGWLLLEFGTNWCGHCAAAQPPLKAVMQQHQGLSHTKEEDGPGRPLGRQFRVKLWPTLVLLKDGQEVARSVRPTTEAGIEGLLEHMGKWK